MGSDGGDGSANLPGAAKHRFADLFRYDHLQNGELQDTSSVFAHVAAIIAQDPDFKGNELLDTTLMRLWEAKNLAVYMKAHKSD